MVIKAGPRWVHVAPLAAALCAILPLFVPEVWSGFRIAQSNEVLSVIAATEQPLSVRSPGGVWAVLLALAWFGLVYWQRRMTLWEVALVVLGGAAVLVRLGNGWLYGLAMIAPLARQISSLHVRGVLVGLAGVGLAVSAYSLVTTRPAPLPRGPEQAAVGAHRNIVLADWRWAPNLQHAVGQGGRVLAAGGLASESPDFWVDYVRITQGHERWAEALNRMGVGLVVLDTTQARPAADLLRVAPDWRVTYDADGVLVAERPSS
jgi:hypothetical protein